MMLRVDSVTAGYGGAMAIRGVSLGVSKNEIVAIIGPNGAGKSTLLSVISGQLPQSAGRVHFEGLDITAAAVHQRREMGITYVPQGHRVFPTLTVKENLLLDGSHDPEKSIDLACDWFPVLRELLARRAGLLSGGEKQSLAFAVAILDRPKLLLLDEPSLGLAPRAVGHTFDRIRQLKNDGLTILLAEQNVLEALKVADRVCALRAGVVVFDGAPADIESSAGMRRVFL